MKRTYQQTSKKDLLEMSSVLENAPYLIKGDSKEWNYTVGKTGTCNCASSRSSGGTCRALSLEDSVE